MIDHSKDRCRQGVDMVLGKTRFGGFFFVCRKLQPALNGQWLTRSQWYVVFLSFTDAFNLDPSTEAQDVLRITDDRPYARMAADRMSQWS
ncbi:MULTISPECIES: hypothetical protein [Pseudomonas]|uniref:Uncharacterized protein n=1 Tax=Pseudomonas fluorescens TaxID=294 RepID=A0A162BH84_PSEFL|nr:MULTISPECIES: hypothetical protein [Pseudomonas]KZN15653.1 hypothetical protein A1D17_05510 [Pseudomonas fluorescens]